MPSSDRIESRKLETYARTLLEAGCAGVVCASVARPAKD